MPLAWKVRRWHLVIGSSVCLFVCPSVCNSVPLTNKVQYVKFGWWQDGCPGLWLAETFFYFSSETTERNSRKLDRKQDLNVLYQVLRWPPWPLIGWDIFDFSSESAEQNSMKFDRKQDLNVLYQVCVFRANQKIKMTALASYWLRHFWLLLWNRWTEFNKTWQEVRFLRPLATKFMFFRSIGKTRWLPWPLIGWDIFDFSSETAERNSTKLDRKQDLNILYQFCIFGVDQLTKMMVYCNQVHDMWPFGPLVF